MESQELAQALGISNAYLSQLEKGIRTHPSAELLVQMVKLLKLTSTMLLVLRRISLIPMRMRSATVVNIMMLKRVQFILGREIITPVLAGLLVGTPILGNLANH